MINFIHHIYSDSCDRWRERLEGKVINYKKALEDTDTMWKWQYDTIYR